MGAFACCTPLFAQNAGYTVTGIVCDSVSHEPQAYATIRLLSDAATPKMVAAITAKADGRFSASVPQPGKYNLQVVVLGKQTVRRAVTFTKENPSLSLDTVYVSEYSSSLAAATITADKPLVKADVDKLTYSMVDDPEAQTKSTLEMLRKVPMVTVDGEDNIKVNGKSGFKVYVNGKPNQMMSQNPSTILKNYPASAIKKIEVITNPGAKYDAEGVAGVLNIITTDETKTSGYTLSPSISYTNRDVNGNVFGMAQFGKFTVSLNYGIGKNKEPKSTYNEEREVFNDSKNHYFHNGNENNNEGLFQFGNLEASYEFSPKDLLSLSAGMFRYDGDGNSQGEASMISASNTPTYGYQFSSKNDVLFMNVNTSFDWQHTFKEDQYFTLSYRLNHSPQNWKSDYTYSNLTGSAAALDLKDRKTDPDKLSYEHTLQADFTTPLGKGHTLSAGLKYVFRINRSDNSEFSRPSGTEEEYQLDEEQSLRYRHRGDIGAAYAEYAFKKEKWSLVAGSRYEYYRAKVTYPDGKRSAFSSDFSDWVPSLSVGYSFQPTMMLKAGYNLRIGRPDISYLSPYRDENAAGNITYGNPGLGSTKSHNINMEYSLFGTKFSVNANLSYSFSNNELVDYSFLEDGVMYSTYGDFLHSKALTLSAFINWTIVKGTVLSINAQGSYKDYKARVRGESNSGWSGNCYAGLQQTLPWKIKLGVNVFANSKGITLQGEGSNFCFWGLNLNRSFLKDDRLTATLMAGNFIGRYKHFRNTTTTSQFVLQSDQRTDFMRLGVGLRFRLGSLKTEVKKAARSIENDDVIAKQSSNASSSVGGAGVKN